jgi:hypothetical protein
MDQTLDQDALTTQENPLAALELFEARITHAIRRTLEATVDIGQALEKIASERLYEARGYQSFAKYLREVLHFNERTATLFRAVAHTVSILSSARLQLPANQAQAVELSKVDPDHLPIFWEKILKICQRKDVNLSELTAARLRRALLIQQSTQSESSLPGAPPPLKVNPVIVFDDETLEQAPGAPPRWLLSEEGERSLNRISRICGEDISNSIVNGTINLSEREIVKWADQDDQMVRNLVHYVVDLRWSVSQALKYESELITLDTTLGQLLTLADARGGAVRISWQGRLISIGKQQEDQYD